MNRHLPVEWFELPEHDSSRVGEHAKVPQSQLDAVPAALARAREAAIQWQAVSVPDRLRMIRRFRRSLAAAVPEVTTRLCGAHRSRAEFVASELIPVLDGCRFLEKSARKLLKARRLRSWTAPLWLFRTAHEIIRAPLGVIVVIGPSNYPFMLPALQVLQGIVAGNAVLLKPGEAGTESAELLARMLVDAGLPENVFQVLPPSSEVAAEVIRSGVDKVFLTGSRQAGRAVLSQTARTVTPAVVELSGCDAALVLPDADLDLAAECVAFGLSLNSGRTCIAPKRAIVPAEVSNLFERKLVAALSRRPKSQIASEAHLELMADLQEALQDGARLVHGSIEADGRIETPIVIADVAEHARLFTAENWGSVLLFVRVADEAEAIRVVERSPFGLAASIFSQSGSKARQLASKLKVGSVTINDIIVPTADGRIPFGGRKQSGFGSTRGPEGLLEMTVPKVISRRSGKLHFHLQPSRVNQFQILCALARILYGGTRGLWSSIRNLVSIRRNTEDCSNL